jgi:hypothetical protein
MTTEFSATPTIRTACRYQGGRAHPLSIPCAGLAGEPASPRLYSCDRLDMDLRRFGDPRGRESAGPGTGRPRRGPVDELRIVAEFGGVDLVRAEPRTPSRSGPPVDVLSIRPLRSITLTMIDSTPPWPSLPGSPWSTRWCGGNHTRPDNQRPSPSTCLHALSSSWPKLNKIGFLGVAQRIRPRRLRIPLTCTNSRRHSCWRGAEIIPNNPVLFHSGHSNSFVTHCFGLAACSEPFRAMIVYAS